MAHGEHMAQGNNGTGALANDALANSVLIKKCVPPYNMVATILEKYLFVFWHFDSDSGKNQGEIFYLHKYNFAYIEFHVFVNLMCKSQNKYM